MTEINLYPLHPEEVELDYLQGINDPDVSRYLSPRFKAWSMETLRAYVTSNWLDSNAILFGIYPRFAERPIGTVRLHAVDLEMKSCYIGICIFDKKSWRQGIGTRAIQLAIDYGVSHGVQTFHAGIHPDNVGSLKTFTKAGFRPVGMTAKGDKLFSRTVKP